jgi:MerR family transcriptional regulator, mercuric resistance operon regulatory protein
MVLGSSVLDRHARHATTRSGYGFKAKAFTMTRELSIGRLAAAAAVNLETIRYYERIKLMPPPARTPGGHRSYGDEHVRRLMFIRRARELGFGIEEIRALLALAAPGRVSCAKVRKIAEARLAEVRAKLADLSKLEHILAGTVSKCSGEPAPPCPVLDMLDAGASVP